MNPRYKMPAEWTPHSATQLHWPSNTETWPGERLERVEEVYLNLISSLIPFEPVHLFVENTQVEQRALSKLREAGIHSHSLTIHRVPVNDVWARDCGPIFVKDALGEDVILDWGYNAWGGKYPPYHADNALPKYIADLYGIKRVEPGMILEGGSIEVNGEGVVLTTESVLLNPNRNPELSQAEIENKLMKYLGVDQVIWLKRGLAGDDTDGHIDDLARFLNEDTVLAMITEEKDDVNYEALQQNLEILKGTTLKNGQQLRIETLPLPQTKIEGTTVDGSEYVPASYANFYIANGVVLVPMYDERYDKLALDLFRRYFPERKVVGIPCGDLVWGQGSIHCITQQWYGPVN